MSKQDQDNREMLARAMVARTRIEMADFFSCIEIAGAWLELDSYLIVPTDVAPRANGVWRLRCVLAPKGIRRQSKPTWRALQGNNNPSAMDIGRAKAVAVCAMENTRKAAEA